MAPRGRKPAVNDSAAKIIEALNFTKIAVKNDADQYGKMAYLTGGWVFTHNGIIAAGASIGENDLSGYVEHGQLAAALSNVGKELIISSGDDGIAIKSGEYEVVVPAYDTETMRSAPPDGGDRWPVGDEFRTALVVAGRVVKDTAENVRDAAIYNNGQMLIATDGISIVEAWHGQVLPPGLVIPKAFANAVGKTDKKITQFSFDQQNYRSFTLWFEDGSFLRTNLYPYADYPQGVVTKYAEFFADFDKVIETPKGFFEAAASIAPFATDDTNAIAITGGAVCTDYREGQGWYSHKAVKGLPEGIWISANRLAAFNDATKVYFGDRENPNPVMLFAGSSWRACVAGIKRPMPLPHTMTPIAPAASIPDPTTAPVWGAPPAASAPAAPPAAAPAPVAEPRAITLPWTPFERHTSLVGSPGWDTTPYTLQPGEKVTDFVNPKDNEARAMFGWPPNPENPTPAAVAPAGAPVSAPASAPAFAPVPATPAAPVQQPQESATFPSNVGSPVSHVPPGFMNTGETIPGGFTPFQPGQAGAPTSEAPAPSTAPAATETAPATASPSNNPLPPWAMPDNNN